MSKEKFDVIGIGNAIVDVICPVDDDFLTEHGLPKGMMTLVDTQTAEGLYASMDERVEVSGGSAANTLAGIASLGGSGAYIGKVGDDKLGDVFCRDMQAIGVNYLTAPANQGKPTARCLIGVTPDAQRTMATYLGVSVLLQPEDINLDAIRAAKITYLEGYLFDRPEAQEAFYMASVAAHSADRKVALTLSDGFCVNRHREEFIELINNHVDILFANELEITALFETDNFQEAISQVVGCCEIAALTRGENGASILSSVGMAEISAHKVDKVIDTTGAGDLFAAGFLFGLTNGYSVTESGSIGALAAAEVIGHYGARPETPLSQILRGMPF